MPLQNITLQVLEQTLQHFKKNCDNHTYNKKDITDIIREKLAKIKQEKQNKKYNTKLSSYNYFIQENMPYVIQEFPNMKPSERITELSIRWNKQKQLQ